MQLFNALLYLTQAYWNYAQILQKLWGIFWQIILVKYAGIMRIVQYFF